MAFPANGTQLREDDGPAGTTDPVPPADAQQQLPIQLKQGISNDQRKGTEEINDTEQHPSRPAALQALDDSPPRQQQQPQSPQPQQPAEQIYKIHDPSQTILLQDRATLGRQSQIIRARLAQQEQQPQPQPLLYLQKPPQPQSSEELRALQNQIIALEAENHRRLRRLAEQQQPQPRSHPQGPPQPQSAEEMRALQNQIMALEAENHRRLRRVAERQAQEQQQQQAEQPQDQHPEESEQSPQPQQPVQQIHPHHGPCGMSQLQSQLQDFRLQQALLERQRQMILARLAEQQQQQQQQQQQEQGQHGDPNVPGSPAVKEEESTGLRLVPVHVLQDYQLGLTLQHRRVQLQSAYRQSRVEHLLARQESMEDSYAQLLLWRLERPSPRTEDEAGILTDLKRLLEAGLVAIQGAMQEPPTVELTDEDRQLDLQLIQLNRLRYAVRDQHIAEGLVEPDEGIRRTMNTRLSAQERFEDLRLHLDRRLA